MDIDRLRSLISYDELTGELTWKMKSSKFGMNLVGKPAGCKQERAKDNSHWVVRIDGGLFLCHRVAWAIHYGNWPSAELDHINLRRGDNRIANLRECLSGIVNNQNVGARRHNTSGAAGVHVSKTAKKPTYLARITVSGKSIHLGSFATAEAASAAYVDAKKRFHPAFIG